MDITDQLCKVAKDDWDKPGHHSSPKRQLKTRVPLNLSGYDFLSLIGSGTYGRVYKVCIKDTSPSQILVLKQVPLKGLTQEEKHETVNESDLMSKLADHNNLVQHFASFIENDQLNIVMEYCAGGDLAGRIKHVREHNKEFTEEMIWTVLIQVCNALKYLHKERILHRDIKPENIFLDANDHVKVGDLGLGRLLSSQSQFAHSTVGTPLYFSPELCQEAVYDERIDIWALGCIVYQMVTLRPPFIARNQIALAQKIVQETPDALPKSCSKDLHFLIHKMLSKDPRRRPGAQQILSYGPVRIRVIQSENKFREIYLRSEFQNRENQLFVQVQNLKEELNVRLDEYNQVYSENELVKEKNAELAEVAEQLQGENETLKDELIQLKKMFNEVTSRAQLLESENSKYRQRLDNFVIKTQPSVNKKIEQTENKKETEELKESSQTSVQFSESFDAYSKTSEALEFSDTSVVVESDTVSKYKNDNKMKYTSSKPNNNNRTEKENNVRGNKTSTPILRTPRQKSERIGYEKRSNGAKPSPQVLFTPKHVKTVSKTPARTRNIRSAQRNPVSPSKTHRQQGTRRPKKTGNNAVTPKRNTSLSGTPKQFPLRNTPRATPAQKDTTRNVSGITGRKVNVGSVTVYKPNAESPTKNSILRSPSVALGPARRVPVEDE